MGWDVFAGTLQNQLRVDYLGKPGWDDNAATFEQTIVVNTLHGDYQLANGYDTVRPKILLSFINVGDFNFLYRHGINTVRIPVGWWITYDPDRPAPLIGGSFGSCRQCILMGACIIDVRAGPGSQNGMEHSASRDGSTDWPNPYYISQTPQVIDFLASRSALLKVQACQTSCFAAVPLDTIVSSYKQGYQIFYLVVDSYYYSLFDNFFLNTSTVDNIQFMYKSRETQLQALSWAGSLVFIGEGVNERNITKGSQSDYQDFGRDLLDTEK
ncbi:unnamed protein product [Malus baccata var. baccata]